MIGQERVCVEERIHKSASNIHNEESNNKVRKKQKNTKFTWQFSYVVTLASTQCKKCTDKFNLKNSTQKTENMIFTKAFLPHWRDAHAFSSAEEADIFLFYQFPTKNVKLSILVFTEDIQDDPNTDVCGPFYNFEEYLVQLKDIGEIINIHHDDCKFVLL